MKKLKAILCALLSVCIISLPVAGSVFTTAATEDIDTLKDKLHELEQKNSEYQDILEKTESDIDDQEEYNDALVEKIKVLNEKIQLTRESISELSDRITENQAAIEAANSDIDDQVDALCERLRAIYMAGSASDLEIILGAKDFSDLIDKISLVKNLSKYDNELIDKITVKLDEIKGKTDQLEADKAELEEDETSLKNDLDELNTTLEENEEILRNLVIKSDEAKSFLENSNSEQAKLEAEIAKFFEEEAKRAAEEKNNSNNSNKNENNTGNNGNNTTTQTQPKEPENTTEPEPQPTTQPSVPSSGGYTWPCPGFYWLSSEWNEDRYTYNHGAIDIAGAGIMGAAVVAADSGTVAYTNTSCYHNWGKENSCGCGGGYGNYVWINHGNGKETIYAHLTSTAVSPGQYVSKGQVIGYVGTTGYSTGPHLHFECRYNGVKYDPNDELHYR